MDQSGSLNVSAADKYLPNLKGSMTCYSSIQSLVLKADELTKQKENLEKQLSTILESKPHDPSCFLLSRLNEIKKEIQKNNKETNLFCNKAEQIKNIPVSATTLKRSTIDFDFTPSQNQSSFFNSQVLEQENENLRTLIKEMEESQERLRQKMKFFKRVQNKTLVKDKIKQIKNGEVPISLSNAYSHRYEESFEEINVAKQELQKLRMEFRELTEELRKEHSRLRRASNIKIKNFSLDKVMKELSQAKVDKMVQAATKIQKLWRGFMERKGLYLKFKLVPETKPEESLN